MWKKIYKACRIGTCKQTQRVRTRAPCLFQRFEYSASQGTGWYVGRSSFESTNLFLLTEKLLKVWQKHMSAAEPSDKLRISCVMTITSLPNIRKRVWLVNSWLPTGFHERKQTALANATILMEHYRQQLWCSHVLESVKKIIYVISFMASCVVVTNSGNLNFLRTQWACPGL